MLFDLQFDGDRGTRSDQILHYRAVVQGREPISPELVLPGDLACHG